MPNIQDYNVANPGDIIKHAALVKLVSSFTGRQQPFNWLDTHSYLLEATPTRKHLDEWHSTLKVLRNAHSGYNDYFEVEREHVNRGRYLCSTGLVIACSEGLCKLFLAERDERTRKELALQLKRRNCSPELLLADVHDFASQPLDGHAGPILALVDPLPDKVTDWPRIWTDDKVGGWLTAQRTIEKLHDPNEDGVVLLYQWRRGNESMTWPEAPEHFHRSPIATFIHQQTDGLCSHHLAVFATDNIAADVLQLLVSLGWSEQSQKAPTITSNSQVPRSESRRFDIYLAADYSGAADKKAQGRAICVSEWVATLEKAESPKKGFTRDTLRNYVLERLKSATMKGQRVLFAFDHQYSWPVKMLHAAGIGGVPWKDALCQLREGGQKSPQLAHPKIFCRAFNEHTHKDMFFSPHRLYNLPTNPHPDFDNLYRQTEQALMVTGYNPKPANEIGTQGAVGGQTICGMYQLSLLLEEAAGTGVKIAVWPFDGLSLDDPAYNGAHVCVEIYPTLLRRPGIQQTDENDATESARFFYEQDRDGTLAKLMDLSALSADASRISMGGWILGVLPFQREEGVHIKPEPESLLSPETETEPRIKPTLTEEQQAVCDCEASLVRVIARAGTGKTTTMVSRAARILRDEPASHVAMLTFTRKAADEMGRLFESLDGRLNKNRLESNTFHGFALGRLMARGGEIDLGDGVKYPLEAVRMLNEFGRESAFDYFKQVPGANLGLGPNWDNELTALINKKEPHNLTPMSLLDSAKVSKSLPRPRETWQALLRFYASEKLMDFDVVMVLFEYLLRTDSLFRSEARGQISHWIADEFQDTNYPQLRSLQQLAGYGTEGDERAQQVIVVGDNFQTIYEWRGAVPDIFEQFHNWNSQACVTLPLQTNFRSCSQVLAVVNAKARVLARDPKHSELYDIAPELLVGKPDLQGQSEVVLDDETLVTVIKRLHEKTETWRRITVLSHTNKKAEKAEEHLEYAGIPVDLVTAEPSRVPGVQRLLAFLSAWIMNGARDLPLWWYFGKVSMGSELKPEGFAVIWERSLKQTASEARETLIGLMGDRFGPAFEKLCQEDRQHGLEGVVEHFAAVDEAIKNDRVACERVVATLKSNEQWQSDPLRLIGEMTRKDFAGQAETNANRVQVSTIHQYKGLENDAVVIQYDFRPNRADKLCLDYVARSRAKQWLLAMNLHDCIHEWENPPEPRNYQPDRLEEEVNMARIKSTQNGREVWIDGDGAVWDSLVGGEQVLGSSTKHHASSSGEASTGNKWFTIRNNDAGSLHVGIVGSDLKEGDRIQIEGEPTPRVVTYIMGQGVNKHVCTGGQGAFPMGQEVRWRKVSTDQDKPSPQQHKCLSCGTQNPPTAKFCNGCGKPLDQEPQERVEVAPRAVSPKQVSSPPEGMLLTKEDLRSYGLDTPYKLIHVALENHCYVSWSAMHEVRWPGQPFQNARIDQMTAAAQRVVDGADALLVDKNGQYSPRAPWQRHYKWLQEHGYPEPFPRVKA